KSIKKSSGVFLSFFLASSPKRERVCRLASCIKNSTRKRTNYVHMHKYMNKYAFVHASASTHFKQYSPRLLANYSEHACMHSLCLFSFILPFFVILTLHSFLYFYFLDICFLFFSRFMRFSVTLCCV